MNKDHNVLNEICETLTHSPKFYARIVVETEADESYFISIYNRVYTSGYQGFYCQTPDATIPLLRDICAAYSIPFEMD